MPTHVFFWGGGGVGDQSCNAHTWLHDQISHVLIIIVIIVIIIIIIIIRTKKHRIIHRALVKLVVSPSLYSVRFRCWADGFLSRLPCSCQALHWSLSQFTTGLLRMSVLCFVSPPEALHLSSKLLQCFCLSSLAHLASGSGILQKITPPRLPGLRFRVDMFLSLGPHLASIAQFTFAHLVFFTLSDLPLSEFDCSRPAAQECRCGQHWFDVALQSSLKHFSRFRVQVYVQRVHAVAARFGNMQAKGPRWSEQLGLNEPHSLDSTSTCDSPNSHKTSP